MMLPVNMQGGKGQSLQCPSLVMALHSTLWDAIFQQLVQARLAAELSEKGARVIGFAGPGDLSVSFAASPAARPLAMLPALQLLGERVAERRGQNTEAPRHLGKVVVLT